ncbi:MAG: cupin domain-containing protein [Thaumarchaeota archaeon]|nr:cupin domain-containing protein [Nitrososphaerota archaeon]
MKIILDEDVRDSPIRVDLAWEVFFESKSAIPAGHGARLIPFTNWLWDELGKRSGNLNKNAKAELTLAVPPLGQEALDFLLRLVSFWADEVHVKKGEVISENLWRKPVVNVFDDENLDGSERSLVVKGDDSYQRFFMPLLGPGRSFFRVEVIQNGASAARFHSHSEVDEYYLILEGSGTLRYNGKELVVKRGDFVGKPTGPDATSQLVADRGEALRILDMEVWHDRPYYSKDILLNPDFGEIIMRGPGWGAIIPEESSITSDDFRKHYGEGYRRTKDGGWVPSKARGHKKIREKTAQ